VRGEANRALRFFDFVKAQLGRFDLGRVDQPLVDRYAALVAPCRAASGCSCSAAADVFDLHELRGICRLRAFPLNRGRNATVFGGGSKAHRRREPDAAHSRSDHHAAALAWSLRYVTHYAGDILAARAELDRLEATRNRLIAAEEGLDPADRRRGNANASTPILPPCGDKGAGFRSGPRHTTAQRGQIRKPAKSRRRSTTI
jgi:hypothetical protein